MSIDDLILEKRFFAMCVLPVEFSIERTPLLFELNQSLFQSESAGTFIAEPFNDFLDNRPQRETSRAEHREIVNSALESIANGSFEKVVVSCIKHVPRGPQSLQTIFERLTERYTNAFVYALHHPVFGIWMGATPELLLHKQGTSFHTVSLAGTQPFSDDLHWSDKLQREQQVVTDFIVEKLSGIRSHAVELNGPLTAQAGPLAHLKTDIRFHSDQSSEAIIGELQPTPAVCGLPREAARTFIQTHARFERRLYAGRLGIRFPTGDEIHFVNLRCMQVFDDHFELHVGGGIVEGSNTEEEWQETEMKADVLRKLLQ